MNTPGEEGSHSQHQPEPFTLGKGKAWDGERGRGKREGMKWKEEKEIEGRKVNGRLFSLEVLFPVSTGQLSHSPAGTMS